MVNPRIYLLTLLPLMTGVAFGAPAGKLEFNRDVRPILSDKCFKCHGPDAKNQKSPFRIDTFANATADLDGYFGVVPGDLKKSEVHWRLHSDEPGDIMPPPETKMPLTPREIAIIDQWIEEGAEFQEHWAFLPLPETVALPKTESSWPQNEIDLFILRRLEEAGLEPSKLASRERWLRRVTFDLTGLPPTIEEIDQFLADKSPDAFEKVVDQLFATDAYAERMTSEWLDVARYSDSYGFQVDRDRFVWPWRDWVIRSFEKNLPYDQFVVEQLAGDMLPDATRDQKLATAFNRLHPQKVEGGSVPEEFRIEYVSDRVHTYGTAFLGLTLECSRCHDHKYDPLTQKDYYSLSAFFANIDEAGLYSFFTPSIPTPTLWLPTEEQEKKLSEMDDEIAGAEEKLAAIEENSGPAFQEWLKGADLSSLQPLAHYSFDNRESDKFDSVAGEKQTASTNANNTEVKGYHGNGVKLTGDDALTFPLGNFTRNEPFSLSLWLQTPDRKERAVILSRSKAWTDAASRGYELLLEDGKLSLALIHYYPGNAIRIRAKSELPTGSWQHVGFSYDGSSRASGLSIYVNGEAIETEVVRDSLTREIVGGGLDKMVIGERMRDSGFKNGMVDEFQVFNRELSAGELAAIFSEAPLQSDAAKSFFLRTAHQPYLEQLSTLRKLREERSELVKKVDEIMTMKDMPDPRQSFILERGNYANRGEPVSPATPEFLPAMEKSEQPDRLDLARWTVSEKNPLTARVTVNRYWQMLFGRGLVATSEDFGSQGRVPTHPELLDWLTRDFVNHGWDVQHLMKTMLLSATYRQESKVLSGEMADRDPENELLSRFPTSRLTAEMLRDNALAVSGLLVNKVGGAPVKPYEISASFKPSKPDTGEGLYRRSLYTYWKQTAPAPMMTTLDASKREVCRVRRERTDSPLQALALLNSPQFVEAAKLYAEHLLEKHASNSDTLIEEAFRGLTGRKPDEAEWPVLRALLEEQTAHFAESPENAAHLLNTGEKKIKSSGDPSRLAGTTIFVSTLMNFDECVSKR